MSAQPFIQNVVPIIVKIISALFCICAQVFFELLMLPQHLSPFLYIIECSCLSIGCMFF